MADQEFPRWASANPWVLGENRLFGKNLNSANCMKMKDIGPRGGARALNPPVFIAIFGPINSQALTKQQTNPCPYEYSSHKCFRISGKLVSLVRSCTLHHGTLDTELLPVPGCTKHELRGAYSMSCVCEEHLCNSALSAHTSIVFHRRFYHTMAILIFLITRWESEYCLVFVWNTSL